MKYKLQGEFQHLIHILRVMIRFGPSGIFDRTWEVRHILADVVSVTPERPGVPFKIESWPLFPNQPQNSQAPPILIDGITLVSRVALTDQIEELSLFRVGLPGEYEYDLSFHASDTWDIKVETEIEREHKIIRDFFEGTRGPDGLKYFC